MLQLYNQISKLHQHEYTRLDSQCILQQFRSVRSSDPLGATFFTTQGLFFFFFFFALFLSKSTTTTESPAVPKDKACSGKEDGRRGGRAPPNFVLTVGVFSQHLRPQWQTGNQFRCPPPPPGPFHKQMTLHCCPLSLMVTFQKFSPQKSKILQNSSQILACGISHLRDATPSLFSQLSSKDLVRCLLVRHILRRRKTWMEVASHI
jgi:hypothetical protein